jgi:hypothetical protein
MFYKYFHYNFAYFTALGCSQLVEIKAYKPTIPLVFVDVKLGLSHPKRSTDRR